MGALRSRGGHRPHPAQGRLAGRARDRRHPARRAGQWRRPGSAPGSRRRRRDAPASQGGRRGRGEADRALEPPDPGHTGRLPGCVPVVDPASHGPGPRHHLRPHGRDQHGARRADGARRLYHLRDPGLVPGTRSRRLRVLLPRRAAPVVSRGGRGGIRPRARCHPLPLRAAARDAAPHLGHQPHDPAGPAPVVRRGERGRDLPQVAVGRACR